MWRYIFSVLLVGGCLAQAFSQEDVEPEKPKKPKKKIDIKPYEIKIGVNAVRIGRTSLTSGYSSQELETALALNRYNLVFDYGVEKHDRGDSLEYRNKGNYFRVGFDRNFSKDRSSGNVLSLGLRYGRANFEDQLNHTADQGFGERAFSYQNPDLSARWFEVALGLRGRLVSNFYMGFTMRWQFARKINGEGTLKTYDVPGFGKTTRKNSTAFDYYLMWRMPFGKRQKKQEKNLP